MRSNIIIGLLCVAGVVGLVWLAVSSAADNSKRGQERQEVRQQEIYAEKTKCYNDLKRGNDMTVECVKYVEGL